MGGILELGIDNFKRISAVKIVPDGNIVEITGKNDQGKSSCIDAIWWAALGKASGKSMPLKRGTDKGGVYVNLGEIKITRRVTAKGSQTLKVTNAEGFSADEPQTLLNKMFKALAFDPEAFSRMDEKERTKTVKEMAGLDTTELDQQRFRLYQERTSVNKLVKEAEQQLRDAVLPAEPEPVGEEKDIVEIAAKKTAAAEEKAANDKVRRKAQDAVNAEKSLRSIIVNEQEEIERLQDELAAAKRRADKNAEEHAAALEKVKEAKEAADKLVDPVTTEIDQQIADAKSHNQGVRDRQKKADEYERAKQARDAAQSKLTIKENEAKRLTDAIEAIDKQKSEAIAAATFPFPGMAIHDELGITIDGVPLEEESSSKKLLVGLHVAAALAKRSDPSIDIICIRHGSLCDAERLKFINDWAVANKYQVWIERTTKGEEVGVLIEEGEVKGVFPNSEELKAPAEAAEA